MPLATSDGETFDNSWEAAVAPFREAASKLPSQENFNAAKEDLKLTPQEEALYQRHLTNLYGPGGVDNPDGSRSTLFQTSFEQDGKAYNVPTVYDGKILKPQDAIDKAISEGLDKFPSYPNQDAAEARYQQMHAYMDKDTGQYFNLRNAGLLPQPPVVEQDSYHDSSNIIVDPYSGQTPDAVDPARLENFVSRLKDTTAYHLVEPIINYVQLAHDVYEGKVSPDSPEAIAAGPQLAATLGVGGQAIRGAVAMKGTAGFLGSDLTTKVSQDAEKAFVNKVAAGGVKLEQQPFNPGPDGLHQDLNAEFDSLFNTGRFEPDTSAQNTDLAQNVKYLEDFLAKFKKPEADTAASDAERTFDPVAFKQAVEKNGYSEVLLAKDKWHLTEGEIEDILHNTKSPTFKPDNEFIPPSDKVLHESPALDWYINHPDSSLFAGKFPDSGNFKAAFPEGDQLLMKPYHQDYINWSFNKSKSAYHDAIYNVADDINALKAGKTLTETGKMKGPPAPPSKLELVSNKLELVSNKLDEIAQPFLDKLESISSKFAQMARDSRVERSIKPANWEDFQNTFHPPVATPNAIENPENLGFNLKAPLFKGATGHATEKDFSSLPDLNPAKKERGFFFSDQPKIAQKYGGKVMTAVVRPTNPMEVDWPSMARSSNYNGDIMQHVINKAHEKGADFLIVKNIDDIGGPQNQYVVLDPKIVRKPDAEFHPYKLSSKEFLAGIGAGGITIPLVAGQNDNQQ